MRDVTLGYAFIFAAVFLLWLSIFVRKRKLEKKLADLREELESANERPQGANQ